MSGLVLFLSWVYMKSITAGTLSTFQRKLIAFGAAFCLGLLYSIAWNVELSHITRISSIGIWLSALWAILIVTIARRQDR
jgi:hypothetical protein